MDFVFMGAPWDVKPKGGSAIQPSIWGSRAGPPFRRRISPCLRRDEFDIDRAPRRLWARSVDTSSCDRVPLKVIDRKLEATPYCESRPADTAEATS
jgi:hypothetical protein